LSTSGFSDYDWLIQFTSTNIHYEECVAILFKMKVPTTSETLGNPVNEGKRLISMQYTCCGFSASTIRSTPSNPICNIVSIDTTKERTFSKDKGPIDSVLPEIISLSLVGV
jgi:hypothetical protein